ncbi:hypothetical protein L1887_19609 [Cichorium endivia]|nr:hypothetical protein L1887_19609 [Cichorium endivia]
MSSSSSKNKNGDLKIPYEEIVSATNNFSDENFIRRGGFGKVYKGQLHRSGQPIDIVARRRAFNNPEWFTTQLENQDLKEESLDVMANTDMMIDHEGHSPELAKALSTECSRDIAGNAVVLVEQKDPPSSSILPHMGQPPNFSSSEMLLAPSLSRNPSNSSSERIRPPSFGNLLVDKQPSSSNLVQSPASSIFIDQEEESNVYAQQRLPLALNPLDMCMFTLAPSARFHYEQRFGHLCIPAEELLAPLAKSHYEEEKLYDLIDPDLWKQMDPLSFNVFSKIAYDCLKEQRAERPNIDQVVIRLQEALSLQRKHEQPVVLNEHSQVATEVIGTSTNSLKATYLETHVAGTVFYLDPEYKNTGKLRKASDIYSLGVVLFEILSGRLAYDQAYMNENVKGLAPFARQHFQINGTLKDMLDPKLKEKFDANTFTWREGPNQDSLQTFLDIAYLCLAETQAHRPKIGTVVEELQNALQLQKNENDKLQFSLDDMKFSPEDIKLATNNFSIKNRIGRGGYGRVFKGEITNPNGRHTNIAAKQLDITGGQGETEFLTELEILLEHKHENVIGLYMLDNACGTNGYCDPQYLKDGVFTKESDIYSFGVVLFEVLCGRLMFEDINGDFKILINTFKRYYRQGKLDDMVFKGIKEHIAPNSLTTFQVLANECVHDLQQDRPTTGDVLLRLEQALEFQVDYETWEPKLPDGYEKIIQMSNPLRDCSIEKKKDLYDELVKGILLQEGNVFPGDSGDVRYLKSKCQNQAKNSTFISKCRLWDLFSLQVKDDEIGELKKVQSDKKMDLLQQLPTNHEDILVRIENEDGGEKLFSLNEVNGKKHLMLSAKATLNNYRNVKLFKTTPSTLSRFPEMIELLPQEVFCISCKIKSQMLSPDTEYACYLVFKLSKKYHGLHGPVKVQDLHHLSDEEVGIVYFRSPSPWNLHDTNQAPKQRADGWMEVKIWKLNLNHELKDDHFHVNLRLISYEGVMAGLIVSGVEFRPM